MSPRVEHQGGDVLRGGRGARIMKRHAGIGLAVAAALSGSLLIGCSSDDATTATSSTPPANPLVGTWVSESSDAVGLWEFQADGIVRYRSGPTRQGVATIDYGTYEVDSQTLTFLTSTYCDEPIEAQEATYTFTVENDQVTFTNTSGDDKCTDRREGLEATTYTAEATAPSPSAS
jgi:hypothetical protein